MVSDGSPMSTPQPAGRAWRGKERHRLRTIGQNLVTWLELAARGKLGNRVCFVWLSVRLKVRGFTSIREGENGYEGQPVVSVTNKPMCGHQCSSWCEDSIGTYMVSPTRLRAP